MARKASDTSGVPAQICWADQYRILHGQAHRKPPARIGTPALTRHLAFWIPRGTGEFELRRERWVLTLDWFLSNFIVLAFERWRQSGESEASMPRSFNGRWDAATRSYHFTFFRHSASYRLGERVVRFEPLPAGNSGSRASDAQFELVSLRVYFDDIPIKIRAELHTEYFQMSFSADLDVADPNRRPNPDKPQCAAVRDAFDRLRKKVEERLGATNDDNEPRVRFNRRVEDDIDETWDASAYLFKQFWSAVDEEFLLPGMTPTISPPDDPRPRRSKYPPFNENLGAAFVDFRGLILSGDNLNAGSGTLHEIFSEPTKGSQSIAANRMTQTDQLRTIDALLPVVDGARRALSEEPPPARRPAHAEDVAIPPIKYEYAASSLHGRRTVFLSALGPQRIGSTINSPGSYIVVTNHRHRWQIGRLVDRLHTVGTLRVASLWDSGNLNKVGFPLRDLIYQVDNIGHRPSRQIVKSLNARFRHLSSEGGEGGLQYRTERALFYVQRFYEEWKALRGQRIEGFQPYEAFVERRIGENWEYLRRLRARHGQISSSLSLLYNELRAAEALQQTRKLGRLLGFAEITAIVPIMYYGGQVLHYAWPWIKDEWCRVVVAGVARSCAPADHELGPYVVIAGTLYAGILLAWRGVEHGLGAIKHHLRRDSAEI